MQGRINYTRFKGTELRLALSEGLSLEISKLSLNKSSKDEEQEDRMEKSSGEIG